MEPVRHTPGTAYSQRSYDALGVFGHSSDLAGTRAVWPRLSPLIKAYLDQGSNAGVDNADPGQSIATLHLLGFELFRSLLATNYGRCSALGCRPALDRRQRSSRWLRKPTNSVFRSPIHRRCISHCQCGNRVRDIAHRIRPFARSELRRGRRARFLRRRGCSVSRTAAVNARRGAQDLRLIIQGTLPISIGINGGDTKATGGVVNRSLDNSCKHKVPDLPHKPGTGGGGGGGGGGATSTERPANPDGDSYGEITCRPLSRVARRLPGRRRIHAGALDAGRFPGSDQTGPGGGAEDRQRQPGRGNLRRRPAGRPLRWEFAGRCCAWTARSPAAAADIDWSSHRCDHEALVARTKSPAADGTLLKVESSAPTRSMRGLRQPPHAAANWRTARNFDGSQANDLAWCRLQATGHQVQQRRYQSLAGGRVAHQQGELTVRLSARAIDRDVYRSGLSRQGMDLSKITDRPGAESACREQGITDAQMLADCILDLAATNDFIFGSQYAHAQKVLAARA